MAWIYLAESEDSHLPFQAGCGQSPIVKSTDMLRLFCYRVSPTAPFYPGLFGMTSEHSDVSISQDQSTSSTADSHARTLAAQELELAWEASEADFFTTSQGLSAKQTRDLYFSKTSQQLELVASTVSRKHLPNSGMIVAGRLYQPPKLVPRTYAKDGFSWPTPIADDAKRTQTKATADARMDRYKKSGRVTGGTRQLASEVLLWPTPRATDGSNGGPNQRGSKGDLALPAAVCQSTSAVGGQLNPTWVEWLMGYPLEWTVLEDWATQWFRSKRKSRSKD